MFLLYLDWNAMGGMRGTPNGDFARLASFIAQYRDRLWIPYSSTHLDDLASGYDPSDLSKVNYTYADLAFIRKLTQNTCFQLYHGQQYPVPDQRDPVEYFESHYEFQQEAQADNAALAASSPDAAGDIWYRLRALMLSAPSIPFPDQARSTELATMFPSWSSEGTIRSVLQDFTDLTTRANTDYTYSTGLRELVRKGLPMLTPITVSSAAPRDVFAHIDTLLAPFMGGISFIEQTEKTLFNPYNRNEPPTLQQRFVHYYYLLEQLGYHPEKLKPKNHFPNILRDAVHAFLAGHCDFFVTDDKGLRYKAKAVYQKLGTRTRVLSVAEFVEFTAQGLPTYAADNYSAYLRNALNDKILLPGQAEDAPIFLLPYDLFDIFNAFELRSDNQLVFFRLEVTYRQFTLAESITQLVNFLHNCLGPSDDGQGEFENSSELELIKENVWPGRKWSTDFSISNLICIGRQPELAIEFLNNDSLADA